MVRVCEVKPRIRLLRALITHKILNNLKLCIWFQSGFMGAGGVRV